jgi:hypothetical protein
MRLGERYPDIAAEIYVVASPAGHPPFADIVAERHVQSAVLRQSLER